MEYPGEEYLMISGIQHFAFCRRQWALIHIEQVWQENLRTAEGRILHERASCPDAGCQGRAVPPCSSMGCRASQSTDRRKSEAGCSSAEACACFLVQWAFQVFAMWSNSMKRRRGQSSKSIRDSGSHTLLSTNMVMESRWMPIGCSSVHRPCAWKRCIVRMYPKVHCSMLHRIGGKK